MQILGTTQISYGIEKILNEAEDYLILVTPYLKLNQRLKVRLSDALKRVDNAYFIYRKDEINYKVLNWLKSFESLSMIPIDNLHAKVYGNEEVLVIGSMNLYEYSQINNHEIGVKIDCYEDYEEYLNALNEIRVIIESQHEKHSFDSVLESFVDYSMGKLFRDLNDNFTFRNYYRSSQELYEFICDMAREIVSFEDFELYRDKSAILRNTDLGKERYCILEKKLNNFAN